MQLRTAHLCFWSMATLAFLFSPMASTALGQGFLIPNHDHSHSHPHFHLPRPILPPNRPRPTQSYKISEISINSSIEDQVAKTQLSQTFVNTGNQTMEVTFVFPLPYDGAVDRLTFMVDGKEYEAKLLKREEARRIYNGYLRKFKDPALLEWVGTGMFKTSVFPVPPGKKRTVNLRFTQLLRKDQNLTDFMFPLSTAKYTSQAIEKLSVNLSIRSKSKIKSVYSPTHAINIQRPTENQAIVKYETKNEIPGNDFRLFYDTDEKDLGASVLSYWPPNEDHGYFLMLASPKIKQSGASKQRKTTILVIDRSGSMSGKKMDQAKESLKFILNNLNENDLFNIVAYDSEVETFRPELEKFNETSRKEALGFINSIFAGGSTNIDGALSTALSMIRDNSLPSYLVFMTDGRPTAGETNEIKLVAKTEKLNKFGSRMVSLGVGYDVNSRLIDRLSRSHRGQSEYVKPDEDIERYVSRVYKKIAAPVMVDVNIKFDFDSVAAETAPTNRVYPKKVFDIFAGQQVTLVGRYRTAGMAKVKINGKVSGKSKKFKFPAKFVDKSANESNRFVAKLWASRRIGEIIDQIDLQGQKSELVRELVALSTKHGIITRYTSFLADDQGSVGDLTDLRRNRRITEERLFELQKSGGRSGFAQRGVKRSYKDASSLPGSNFSDSETESLELAEGVAGRGGFGGGGGAKAKKNAVQGNSAFGGVIIQNAKGGKSLVTDAVRQAGSNTLYRRGKVLIAANAHSLDLKKDAKKIVEIERFSDKYFEIVKENSRSENLALARQNADEELIISLRGTYYRFK